MKRILSVDGGGAKGLIPGSVLDAVERTTGRPLWQTFDLIVGTSVGSILGAIAATGKLNAADTLDLMYDTIPRLFSRRMWPLLPKYSRKPYEAVWRKEVGDAFLMRECRTPYMCTAVNLCDGQTHYFKSWEPKDGGLRLVDATLRSFAAPLYFGGLVDKANKAVWLDGGTGGDNCPLLEATYEAVGWLSAGHDVHILSLGCGHSDQSVPFARASMWLGRNTREVGAYADISDGGMARQQSTRARVDVVRRVADILPALTLDRVDTTLPGDMDIMDGVRYADAYVRIGAEIARAVDYSRLT